MTKPAARACECGCGVLLAQRASHRGGARRFYSDVCARRAMEASAADAAEDKRVRNLKRRLLYADAKTRLSL